MYFLFGIFWLFASILIALFINGIIFKSKRYFKIGLSLIIFSFMCGIGLLAVAITSI